jgi:hypothetical protein
MVVELQRPSFNVYNKLNESDAVTMEPSGAKGRDT